MPSDAALTCRNTAARIAFTRIERDAAAAPPALRPFLGFVRRHLFDQGLTVARVRRACGLRDNSISLRFRRALGLAPAAYIAECRLLTAVILLADFELGVSVIAAVLGYSSTQVMSTAFLRWCGERPSAFRQRARAATPRPGERRWQRALATVKPDAEAVLARVSKALAEGLAARRRDQPGGTGPGPLTLRDLLDDTAVASIRSQALWDHARAAAAGIRAGPPHPTGRGRRP